MKLTIKADYIYKVVKENILVPMSGLRIKEYWFEKADSAVSIVGDDRILRVYIPQLDTLELEQEKKIEKKYSLIEMLYILKNDRQPKIKKFKMNGFDGYISEAAKGDIMKYKYGSLGGIPIELTKEVLEAEYIEVIE